eukprot:7389679-Prymnesium_polylepis.1
MAIALHLHSNRMAITVRSRALQINGGADVHGGADILRNGGIARALARDSSNCGALTSHSRTVAKYITCGNHHRRRSYVQLHTTIASRSLGIRLATT